MNALREILLIARMEAGLLRRFPRLYLAVIGAVVAPALYALTYLESIWDPASRTEALPAIIVNLDQGAEAYGRHVDLGAELTQSIQERRAFGFTLRKDEAQARREVREGRSLFALIIPRDFSANALSGNHPGNGKLVLFASEGNNYTGAAFARRFAVELGHQVNETLNEQRWALVLGAAAGSGESLARFRAGIAQLQSGARAQELGSARARDAAARLASGGDEAADGVRQLADGLKQMGSGARTLVARQPSPGDLDTLKSSAARLSGAHADLGRGLKELETGAATLADGAERMRDEARSIPFVGDDLSGRIGPLVDGASQLRSGIRAAHRGETRLAEGAHSLSLGVASLVDGVAALGTGTSALVAQLPPDDRVELLAEGTRSVADGARQLTGGLNELGAGARQMASGLDLLARSLPPDPEPIGGTARGLAASVEPDIQIDAPVQNQGGGYAPSFIPVSLWLGAVTLGFIFNLRQLPAAAEGRSRLVLLFGKFLPLAALSLGQSLVVLIMVLFMLGIHAVHPAGLALTLATASMTFMLITLALVRAFGDAGKALASVLLIVQVSAAGGIVPIELTSPFFRELNPWLPFTWVVRAVQANMFGAFGDDWGAALGIVLLSALGALVLAAFVGRWRFVEPGQHRPAIEL